ncbi:hypothetical protein GA0115254_128487 [Streptomyces sp. Ncost-T10-10d]|nr:hypothetical protein GA0115254_128487 [Streptomyces sp. Ncost-T10-10d]
MGGAPFRFLGGGGFVEAQSQAEAEGARDEERYAPAVVVHLAGVEDRGQRGDESGGADVAGQGWGGV